MQWHGFWWIFPLFFFVMMIVMCLFRSRGGSSESALNILDKRYASGEIDKQEYEEKKAAIISR
jgi:putative membrane protein